MQLTGHENSIEPISMKAAVSSTTVVGSLRGLDILALRLKIQGIGANGSKKGFCGSLARMQRG
jgi:hypothetical protein